jgi:hypothetical protein
MGEVAVRRCDACGKLTGLWGPCIHGGALKGETAAAQSLRAIRRVNPDCVEDLVNLAREVAALRTWEELADAEDEVPLKSGEGTLDDTIERARNLLDNWGLHGA